MEKQNILELLNKAYEESPAESWSTYTEGWKDALDLAIRIIEDGIDSAEGERHEL